MDILKNELVRKYFGCHLDERHTGACKNERLDCLERMAFRVLAAMQEPIRKGELILRICPDGSIEHNSVTEDIRPGYHFEMVRLPDKFQVAREKECFHHSGSMGIEHPCPECGTMLCWNLDLSGKPFTEPPLAPEKCPQPHVFSKDCALCHNPADSGKCPAGLNHKACCCVAPQITDADRMYETAKKFGEEIRKHDSEKAVEKKIKKIVTESLAWGTRFLYEQLRELVELARKQ